MKFMKTNRTQSQPEASAPRDMSKRPETQEQWVDQRIATLINRHLVRSHATTTDTHCVFWILDLEDEAGKHLTRQLLGKQSPGAAGEDGRRPSSVSFATELCFLSALWAEGGNTPLSPPPSGSFYLVVVTANTYAVALPRI